MKSKYSSGFPPHRRNLENKFFKRVLVNIPFLGGVVIEKKFNESMGIYRAEIIRVGLLKRTWSGCKTMSADLTCGDAEFIFIDEMQVSGENGGIQSLDSTPRSEIK